MLVDVAVVELETLTALPVIPLDLATELVLDPDAKDDEDDDCALTAVAREARRESGRAKTRAKRIMN